jgi:hypothetical protein
MPTAKRFKVIQSKTGSDFTFPTKMVDGAPKSLTAPWDRAALLPDEFQNDPYILDAAEKGQVEISDADKIPTGPLPFPKEVDDDPILKGFATALLYGAYTDQLKSYSKDWTNKRLAEQGNRGAPARINSLRNRVLPLVRCIITLEKKLQNRADVLSDMKRVEKFITGKEWEWDVQET